MDKVESIDPVNIGGENKMITLHNLNITIKNLILKWCLIIAGRIDQQAVTNCTIGIGFSVNLKKIIPPDGKSHNIAITSSFWLRIPQDEKSIKEGVLEYDSIKVYKNGDVIPNEHLELDYKVLSHGNPKDRGATLTLEPKGISPNQEIKIYYMRDNHTFKQLSLNYEDAINQIKYEFECGFDYGMLSSHFIKTTVHSNGIEKWEEFKSEAKKFYEEIDYEQRRKIVVEQGI